MLRCVIIVLALGAFACSGDSGPPLAIDDVRITRPLPGTSMSAGYFVVQNHGSSEIVITAIDSPQFARVEMHETVMENDVSRMRGIDELRIGPRERVEFVPGGKHLMLSGARSSLQTVTLNIYSGEALLLSVSSTPTDP